jgi:carbon monoxide dehydrogenase subunit G
MATIRKEIQIAASPEDVWSAIRDVGAVARLFPGVLLEARLEEGGRVVTFANGLVVRERIVDVDDGTRRLVYSAVGGRATHHNASLQVFAEGDARSRVVWITDLLPDEIAPQIAALVEKGAEAMTRALEGAAPR